MNRIDINNFQNVEVIEYVGFFKRYAEVAEKLGVPLTADPNALISFHMKSTGLSF